MSLYNIIFNTSDSNRKTFGYSFLSNKQRDRREDNQYIAVERRANTDRRTAPRFNMDSKLNNDIQGIKDTYSSIIPDASFLLDAIKKRDTFIKRNSAFMPSQFQSSYITSTSTISYQPENNIFQNSNVSLNSAVSNNTSVYSLLNQVKVHKNSINTTLKFLGVIIPFRRIQSATDKLMDGDYIGLGALLAVALVYLPEDLRDVRGAIQQTLHKVLPSSFKDKIKSRFPKFYEGYVNFDPKYDFKNCQIEFSTIRGSNLEKPVNKIGGKLGYLIHERDRPLSDSKFGQFIGRILKVEEVGEEFTGRSVPKIEKHPITGKFTENMVDIKAVKLKGSFAGKTIYRALQRTTRYGALTVTLITAPSIIKAFMKSKNTKDKVINGSKQTVKSAISVISTLSGIGIIGALLAPLGPAGSVAGMAIGAIAGSYLSSKINENIQTC